MANWFYFFVCLFFLCEFSVLDTVYSGLLMGFLLEIFELFSFPTRGLLYYSEPWREGENSKCTNST